MQLGREVGAPPAGHAQQRRHPLVALAERTLGVGLRGVAAAGHEAAQQRERGRRCVGPRGKHRRALGEQRRAEPDQSAPRSALAAVVVAVAVGIVVCGGGGRGLQRGERGGERGKELELGGRWEVGHGDALSGRLERRAALVGERGDAELGGEQLWLGAVHAAQAGEKALKAPAWGGARELEPLYCYYYCCCYTASTSTSTSTSTTTADLSSATIESEMPSEHACAAQHDAQRSAAWR